MKACAVIYHDLRRVKKAGTYPVKIKVTYRGRREYYATRFEFSKEDYLKLYSPRVKEPYKSAILELNGLLEKAQDIIQSMRMNFRWDVFATKFLQKRIDISNVYSLYDEVILKLFANGQIGNAINYKTSLASLKKFSSKENLYFHDITPHFLDRYEKWMLTDRNERGRLIKARTKTSVSIYLRALRAIYNIGMAKGEISQELYPFGKQNGFVIPAVKKTKRALSIIDIAKIFQYESLAMNSDRYIFSRDMFVFSYLGNGISVKDIAYLKYKNINGDFIEFVREKTVRTKKDDQQTISFPLFPESLKVIEKWGNPNRSQENYIFPILSPGLSKIKEFQLVQQAVKNINKYTKRIGEELGLNLKLTSYVARHSFSGVLLHSGKSVEYISEQLGHSNIKTTQHYLSSFQNETKKENNKALTNFLHKKSE